MVARGRMWSSATTKLIRRDEGIPPYGTAAQFVQSAAAEDGPLSVTLRVTALPKGASHVGADVVIGP